jgi:protein subunit release factor A
MTPDPNIEVHGGSRLNPGGQHVGVSMGVTVRHIPTNTTIYIESERSQMRNRDMALRVLGCALEIITKLDPSPVHE